MSRARRVSTSEAFGDYKPGDITPEGRVVTGVHDGNAEERTATEIKGKAPQVITSKLIDELPIAQQSCGDGNHDMQPDPTEKEFEAERCSRCKIGRLIRPKN